MYGYGDLNNVHEDKYIQPKSPSRQASVQVAVSESSWVGKVQIKETHTCKDDDSARSRKSFTSVDSAHFKRAKAELEKKRCLERHEIERQQQVLEQQLELLRVKQEMDEEQAKLRHKRELLTIEQDIKQAKLEEEVEKVSTISDKPQSSSCHVNARRSIDEFKASERTKTSHIMDEDELLPLYQDMKVIAELPRTAKQKNSSGTNMGRNEENYGHLQQANNSSEVRFTTPRNHPMDRGHSDEKESFILFAETIGTSIRKGFEMPKRDCLTFDGNPMNYPRFIKNFKTNIEEREQSPRVRLVYLSSSVQVLPRKRLAIVSCCPKTKDIQRQEKYFIIHSGKIILSYVPILIK